MTIAVIIPARNGADYIDKALASIVTQTVPVDKVVVVDDDSEDDTYDRATRWGSLLPLQVIRREQTGRRTRSVWHARHLAVEAADTDLILQLDCDDLLLPGAVACMTRAYARRPGLVAPRRLILVEGETDGIPRAVQERLPESGDQYNRMLAGNYIGVGCLYSRDEYKAVGGYRPCCHAEDWDLWLRFTASGVPISLPAEPTYVYNVHRKSTSGMVDRGVTDQEVLRRFLDSGTEAHRRTAKLALLQRAGLDYVRELEVRNLSHASVNIAATGLAEDADLEVRWDKDLGFVLIGRATAEDLRRLVVVSSDGAEIILRSIVGSSGSLESTEADPALRWEATGRTWYGWLIEDEWWKGNGAS
ncbi:glycosyltransferase family 2 protein [Streptomyces sp. NPDC048751]|uniref:glycosyltransferase family 2 protein n=1 Tax=Streptomyces sp. NPDC048751 TaxID=3365591 RepID=UPI003717E96E